MSSYASVAAQNAPSPSQQPRPDPALLTTEHGSANSIVDDSAKVKVVSGAFKENPMTYTSEVYLPEDSEDLDSPGHQGPSGSGSRRLHEVEAESVYLWQLAKQCLFRPGVAGGLVGLVNVGLLSGAGYALYMRPHLRRDPTAISSGVAGALLVLGAEGYVAERYRKTPRGQKEARRARTEGTLIYRHLREQVLRPGVLGGLVGLFNAGVIGLVGFSIYANWERPRWNRDILVAVSAGLLALWGGEGYLADQYRKGQKH